MKGFKKVLQSWAHKKEGKPLLEGKQFLFLRAHEDLTEEQAQERIRIGEQLPVLEMAWQLKEELRTWYATSTVTTAETLLDAWIASVQTLGLEPFSSFCPCVFPMALWKARTTAPKPSCAKAMAIAIAPICDCAFYWAMSHELFTTFPRKDGEPPCILP